MNPTDDQLNRILSITGHFYETSGRHNTPVPHMNQEFEGHDTILGTRAALYDEIREILNEKSRLE